MYPNVHCSIICSSQTWKQPECPSTNEWIKKIWYLHTMEYFSAIKRNEFESVVVSQRNTEPQKEKNKYHILAHIYRIQKNYTDKAISRDRMDTKLQRMDLWTQQGKERVGWIEKVALTYICYQVYIRQLVGSYYITQRAQHDTL